MSIQREFPSYDDMKGFADLLAKLPGFVDSSWHNDTCPSMEHEESKTKIWVEYADPDNRENSGPRFSIEQGESGDADCVFATDDAAEVFKWVQKQLVQPIMSKIDFDVPHLCPHCNEPMEVCMPIWITPGERHIDTSEIDYESGNPKNSGQWWCETCQSHHFPVDID